MCTFTYSATDPAFNIGAVEGLQAEGESERRVRIWWEKGGFDSYRIYYKKTGEGHEWFHSDLLAEDLDQTSTEGELKLYGLEPDTGYEARAQGKKRGMPGPYTEIIKFRTMPIRPAYCGDPALLPEGGTGDPYLEAIKGDIVNVDGMEMTLLDVVHLGDGRYKGLGRVSVDYFGGAAFTASFDRIFINEDRQVVLGRIDFVTKGTAAMVGEQLAAQEEREEEKENGDLAEGHGNKAKDIIFEGVIDSLFVDGTGEIVIIDTEGERVVYEQPVDPGTGAALPVNIVDSGGNEYVVDSEGDLSQGRSGNALGGSTERERNLTGIDSLVYEVIVQRIEASEAVIDSLKEKMQPSIEKIEGIIENENFYPPRIRGKNDELIGEGISLYISIINKPESVKERLSPSVKSIDETRNNLIKLDIPIQELKPAIDLLNDLKEGDPFEEFMADIRSDNSLPENTTERIQYIEELLDQRISENEE